MSAAGIIFRAISTGRVLLQFRSGAVADPHQWHIWGGRMEAGEAPIQTAIREAREEAQWDGTCQRILPVHVLREGEWSYTTFLAEVEHEFSPALNEESGGFAWFPAGIMPGPAHPHLPLILDSVVSASAPGSDTSNPTRKP